MRFTIKKHLRKFIVRFLPNINVLRSDVHWKFVGKTLVNVTREKWTKINPPYHISDTSIGKGTYISQNSRISMTNIGRFCSIGPNFFCGWGIHPISGISTSPIFYSTRKQSGYSFSEYDQIDERKSIRIGNDVFIGLNVTVLDGVSIGDGAVIGAGAIIAKDIPPYAIVVGNPPKILKYRFDEQQREKLQEIAWWNFDDKDLKTVEKFFFDVDQFIISNERNCHDS